jgi:opacity protein-like surface antigen
MMTRFLFVFVLSSAFVSAQTGAVGPLDEAPTRPSQPVAMPTAKDQAQFTQEFGFWGGYAPTSTIAIGVTHDRRLFTLNGKYSIVVLNSEHTSLRWVSEVVPIAVLHQPTEQFFNSIAGAVQTQQSNTRYAFGVTPLGLQFNVLRHRKVQPFADIHAGLLYFNENVPVPTARRFNFTFNFGAGVEIFTTDRGAMTVGFKYHHISNNETAPANPGVDSPMAYVGYSWYKRHR